MRSNPTVETVNELDPENPKKSFTVIYRPVTVEAAGKKRTFLGPVRVSTAKMLLVLGKFIFETLILYPLHKNNAHIQRGCIEVYRAHKIACNSGSKY